MARIVHLISHAAHYNTPLYRRIAKQFSFEVWYERSPMVATFDPGFNQTVDWGDEHLSCGYEWEVVETRKLADAFRRRKPDVLWVHGYATPRNLYAIYLAKRYGCKVWIRGETHLRLPTSSQKLLLRRAILPWLFRQVDVCLYIGTWNRQFYEHYGVTKEKLVFMPYCVDNEFWMAGKTVPRENLYLYVGKLLPEKGIDMLLDFADENPNERIVVAGDGPVKVERPNITKLGFQTPEQLRDLYYRAGCLLMFSKYEPWGLVLNEAMCCNLPASVTKEVPAVYDLPVNNHLPNTQPWMRWNWSYDQDIQGIEEAMKR